MKYGESTFDILYLVFAIVSGCIILAKARNRTGIVVLAMMMLPALFQSGNSPGFAENAAGDALFADAIHRLASAFGIGEYEVGADEIALFIQLDTEEDIGLLVFDYCADGREHSGGISNADKTLMKHGEQLIVVMSREDLESSADAVDMTVQFRIITEYVSPNFENVYPDSITKILEPVSFEAHFGSPYRFTISGDRTSGYQISQTG